MILTINGEPVGKGRPRFYNGHAVTPKKTKDYEESVRELFTYSRLKKIEGPVSVEVLAYYAIPKSATKGKKEAMRSGKEKPTIKPDIDNVVKVICDALNGYAYEDDKQIVQLSAIKGYADEPKVIVQVSSVR